METMQADIIDSLIPLGPTTKLTQRTEERIS